VVVRIGRLVVGLALVGAVAFPSATPLPLQSKQVAPVLGTVSDHVGRSIKGADVRLSGGTKPETRHVITDSAGRFLFADVPFGTFSIEASKGGFSGGAYGQRYPSDSPMEVQVTSASSPTDSVRLILWPLGRLNGVVVREDGKPLPDTTVAALRWSPVGGGSYFSVSGRTKTDAGGNFSVPVGPGKYLIAAQIMSRGVSINDHTKPATPLQVFFPGVLSTSSSTLLNVAPGEDIQGLRITQPRTTLSSISGQVLRFFTDLSTAPGS
jgi:hypothetical protein